MRDACRDLSVYVSVLGDSAAAQHGGRKSAQKMERKGHNECKKTGVTGSCDPPTAKPMPLPPPLPPAVLLPGWVPHTTLLPAV